MPLKRVYAYLLQTLNLQEQDVKRFVYTFNGGRFDGVDIEGWSLCVRSARCTRHIGR